MIDENALQSCKTQALHRVDAVQGHGAMIAVNRHTWVVEACSDNLHEHSHYRSDELLGSDFRTHAPELYQSLDTSPVFSDSRHLTSIRSPEGKHYTMLTHSQRDHLLIELEPGPRGEPNWWTEPQRIQFIKNLADARDIDKLCQVLVEMVAESGRFDRVMMYRFLKDWHGVVTHEIRQPGTDGFLGLHFPASDLPANARSLYEANLQRVIRDTREPVRALRYLDDDTPGIDMTHLLLRSVHPVHIRYLENLGVRGSFSLSILIDGKLWGMVACHHYTPIRLSARERLAMEEIARLASLHLNSFIELDKRERLATKRSRLGALASALAKHPEDPIQPVAEQLGALQELFGASGAWFRLGTEERSCGRLPSAKARQRLLRWLQSQPQDVPTATAQLDPYLEGELNLRKRACGILYLPLREGGFLALFRPERIHTVIWAGRPENAETWEQPALTPRRSFSKWAEEVKGQAEPWDDVDTGTAAELQQMLSRCLETTQIHRYAHRDPLTGLANRRAFERTLDEYSQPTEAGDPSPFALHLLDLDRFKPINDTFGHSVGDAMLKMVSSRLEHLIRESDMVARLGGDEFAILQIGVEDAASIRQFAERLVKELSQPYYIHNHLLEVGASVGIACFPTDALMADALIEKADSALYRVKESGRNGYHLFAEGLAPHEAPEEDARQLKWALEEGQFTLSYQPVYHLETRRALGFEALARWKHPEQGLLTTQDFLQQLEDNHLLPAFGELMLERIFRQQRHWQLHLGHPVPVFANISATQLLFTGLVATLRRIEKRYGIGFGWLRLDIQSQSLEQNPEEARRRMRELSHLGAALYLDNFRYGSLSVELLGELSLSGIKASARHITELAAPRKRQSLLRVLKGLADLAGGELIITQVETREMLEWLATQGVESVQGFAVQAPAAARYMGLKQSLIDEAVIDGF